MILTKDGLLRALDELADDVGWMKTTMHQVTEQLRPVEAVDTDVWSTVEYSQERLDQLVGRIIDLRRDVLSDL